MGAGWGRVFDGSARPFRRLFVCVRGVRGRPTWRHDRAGGISRRELKIAHSLTCADLMIEQFVRAERLSR